MSSEADPSDASTYKISRQASNKITYKITLIAEERCKESIRVYNECAKGRNFSMLWNCKNMYTKSQDCVHQFLNDGAVDMVTRRWVDAGKPTKPDWNELLAGIGPQEAQR